jgi:VCBS repeat-containing protein
MGDNGYDSETVNITVDAVNDEEVLATNAGASVAEGSTGNVITTAMLETTDVDQSAAQLIYTVDAIPANGILRLSGTALGLNDTFTQADIDAGNVTYDHDGSQTLADSFDFTVDDGEGTTTSSTFNFTVINVNDAPVNTVPGAQSVDEDTPINITGISVADNDDNLSTVQLTVGNGTLNVTLSGAATISAGANDSGDVTLSGSLADINATLASVTYQGNLNFNGTDTLTVLSTDTDSETDSDTVTINVNAVNDDPTNAGSLPSDVTVTEDASSNVDLSAINVSDVDDAGGDLTVTLTTSTGGNLSAAAGAGITIGGTSTALTLTGSQGDLNAYLNTASNIQYLHGTANTFGNDADTINVVINDNGNTGTGGGTDQNLGTVNVDITAVNDAPVVATNTGITIAEGGSGVITTAMLNEGDVDDSGADVTYLMRGDFNQGAVKLNGTALVLGDTFTQADIDAGLVTVHSSGAQDGVEQIRLTILDGGEDGATGTDFNFFATITDVNDAPVAADDPAGTVTDLATDPDTIGFYRLGESAGSTAVDEAGNNDGTYNNVTLGATGVTGGDTAADFDGSSSYVDLGNLDVAGSGLTMAAWINVDSFGGSDGRIFAKSDGSFNQDHTFMLSLLDQGGNNYLRLRLSAGGYTEGLIANSAAPIMTGSWYHVAATYDVTTGDMAIYLNGEQVEFANHSVGGAVDQDPTQNVWIGGNPIGGNFFDGRIDEAVLMQRALTGSEIAALAELSAPDYSVTESATLNVNAANGLLQNDSDADGDSLTITEINGVGANVGSQIAIGQGGLLTVNADGSFDFDTNGQYEDVAVGATYIETFTYTVSDGNGGTDTATGSITINGENDTPTITDLAGDTLNYTEGDGSVVIEQGGDAAVADIDSADFDGGNLSVFFFSGNDDAEDVLSIRNQGTGSGQIGVSGTDVTYEGTIIGTFTGGSSGANLVVTFNANANQAATTALIQNITYENTDTDNPTTGTRNIHFQVADGDGDTSVSHVAQVNVGANNDTPTIDTNAGATASEGGGIIIDSSMLSASDVDNDNSTLTYTITDVADNGFVALVSAKTTPITSFTQAQIDAGDVIYFHDGTDTTTDLFDFSVSDGNTSATGTFNLTIDAVNDAAIAVDDTNAFTVLEDGSQNFDVLGNDTDSEGDTRSITHVDGQAISSGGTVSVSNGTVTLEADGTLTFTADADYNGPISFEYSISDRPTASGAAGQSLLLEASADFGTQLFSIDLDSAEKTYIGDLPVGSTAMGFDASTDTAYFINSGGGIYAWNRGEPLSSATLIGNLEDTGSGWTNPIPSAYSHQTAAFYNGSLYFVPTTTSTPAVDDALYRVDFSDSMTISDVVKVTDLTGDSYEWNNNDDIAIDAATGILYGRGDLNNSGAGQRESILYSYNLNTSTYTEIAREVYAFDYVDPSNNPSTYGDFRDASTGLTVGADGNLYGSDTEGLIVRINTSDGSTTSVSTFTVQDSDGGAGGDLAAITSTGAITTGTVTGNVTAVNDAPVLDNSGDPALTGITEDDIDNAGVTVADLLATGTGGDPISDVEGDPEGIAITVRNNGRGIWEYSIDGGTNWSSVGTVSETSALLLRANDLVRFNPDGANAPVVDPTIEFRAWDQSSGTEGTKVDVSTNGGSTAFSSASETASISVTDVNDAPVLDNSFDLQLDTQLEDAGAPVGVVGTSINSLVSDVVNVSDVDASSTEGVAITAADTTDGTWWYSTDNGTNWNALGSVSESSARVLSADSNTRIYFQSDADFNGTVSDAITFRAWDRSEGTNGSLQDVSTNGGTTAYSADIDTADISVTPVSDAPTGTDNTVTAFRDGTYVFTSADFGFNDLDGDSFTSVLFSGAPTAGTLFIDTNNNNVVDGGEAITAPNSVSTTIIDNGRVKFQPVAGASGAGYATLDFQVVDDGGTANGGADTDPTANTITIDVNDAYRIEGNVLEDVNGDSNLADAVGSGSVTVYLYQDVDDDNAITAADTLYATTTTDGSGFYQFTTLADDTYFVVVDSSTIAASAGLNATYAQTDIWAEQTYGVAGAAYGAGFLGANGTLYGGRAADVSDDASALLTAEHVTRVTVSGADTSNIDSAFSFNVVTGVRDGDDVGGEGRSVQGSLRQFVDNANAIVGSNEMRFVPGVSANSTGASGDWWGVTLASSLATLSDAGTTIDGSAYNSADGTTVLNTNTGNVNTARNVGVDGLTLDAVERQELQIDFGGTNDGIVIDADHATVSDIALIGQAGGGATINITENVFAGGEATIERTVIGANADGSDPGANSGFRGMAVNGAANISNNFIAFVDGAGLRFNGLTNGNSSAITFINNEIFSVGGAHAAGDAATIDSTNVTFQGNYIHDVSIVSTVTPYNGKGIELWYNANNNIVDNNTVEGAVTAGIGLGADAAGNTISKNVITGTTGSGGDGGAGILLTNAGGNPTDNVFTQNSIYANAGIGIDIDSDTTFTTAFGDGQNVNDGDLTPTSANQLIDHPIIETANLVGSNLALSGYVGAAANDADFSNARVEFFVSDGSGEGQTYLGFLTTDANGNYAGTLSVSSVIDTDAIVATATMTGIGTSEFGNEHDVNVTPTDIAPNSLAVDEHTNTSGGYILGSLTSTDADAGDTFTYSIVGGADQASFSISGEDLVLTDGTLDHETQATYSVRVRTTDADGLFYEEDLTINVNDLNDAPIITGGPDTSGLTETDSGLTDSGTLTVSDEDQSDTVGAAVDSVVVTGTGSGSVPGSLTNTMIRDFLTVSPTAILDGTETTDTLTWDFDSGSEAFDFLATGETLVLTYTVSATDDDGVPLSDTETVTITVTGTNDTPQLTAVDVTGAVTEDASAPNLTDSGSVSFTELDGTDSVTSSVTLSTTATTGPAIPAGLATALNSGLSLTQMGTNDGTIDWDFNVANSLTQYLAAGETVTATYTITVSDDSGAGSDATTQDVTVTITGTNDTPTITVVDVVGAATEDASNPNLTDSGSVTFAEVDDTDLLNSSVALTNTITTGPAVPAGLATALNSGLSLTQTGTNDGTIDWDFNVANSLTQYLADGETVTATYTITVTDDSGTGIDTTTQDVTVVITGANDTPTITVVDVVGAVTEDASTPNLTDGGSVSFAEVDDTDLLNSSVALTNTVTTGPSVPAGLATALSSALSLTQTGTNDGSIAWDFSVANSEVQYLADGETVTATYTITVADDSGTGMDSATQNVTVVITGTNDTPTITVVDVAGAVTEDASTPNLTDSGSVTFAELDETDVINSSVALTNTITTGPSVPAGLATALNSALSLTQTGTNDGSIDWDFSVANSLTQYLADGETVTATYTVTLTDDSGTGTDTTTQDVTVVITGTNDTPTITVVDVVGAVTEDASTPNLTDSGSINFSEVDDTDLLNSVVSLTNTTTMGPTVPAGLSTALSSALSLTQTGTNDGSIAWDFNVPNSEVQYLAAGETVTATYTITVTDDSGTGTNTTTQDVTVVITGTNDGPVAVAGTDAASEDGAIVSGTLTETDSDTTDTHTFALISNTSEGNAVVQPNGDYTFDPGADFQDLALGETRDVSFTFEVTDNNDATSQNTITITVTGTNDGPVAQPGINTAIEDGTVINGTLTETDVDTTDTHTFALVSNTSEGNVIVQPNGDYTFDPGADFQDLGAGATRDVSFTFEVTDNNGATNQNTITIRVTGTNDAPTAVIADNLSVNENTDTAGGYTVANLVGTDIDAGETLSFSIVGGTDASSFSIIGNQLVLDDGVLDFETQNTYDVTVRVTDSGGLTHDQSVTIVVQDINEAPVVINNNLAFVVEEQTVTIDSSLLTTTDQDQTAAQLTYTIDSATVNGTLFINGAPATVGSTLTQADINAGRFTYTHINSNATTDSFSFTVDDGQGLSVTGQTFNVSIGLVNDVPIAADDSYTIDEDSAPVTLDVVSNDFDQDFDPLSISIVSTPDSGGSLSVNLDGTFNYQPVANYFGTETFVYEVNDGRGGTDQATVTVTINPVNDAPDAQDDSYVVLPGLPHVTVNSILSNDSDIENSALTAVLLDGPDNGQIALQANGQFTYTPNDGFVGADSFTYMANDGTDMTVARVEITVIGIVIPPVDPPTPDEPTDDNDNDNDDTDDGSNNSDNDSSSNEPSDDNDDFDDNEEDEEDEGDVVPGGIYSLTRNNVAPILDLRDTEGFESTTNDLGQLTRNLTNQSRASTVLRAILLSTSPDDVVENRTSEELDRIQIEARFYSVFDANYLFTELDDMEQSSQTMGEFDVTVGAVTAFGTIGYVLWALRGGTLVALALSQLPAWQMIDPLPILDGYGDENKKSNKEDLEGFFTE